MSRQGRRIRNQARELLKKEEALADPDLARPSLQKKKPKRDSFLVRYGRFQETNARSAYLVIPGEIEDLGEELQRLAESLGLEVCGKKILKSGRRITGATFIGQGTIDEIRKNLEGFEDPILIIDYKLSPGQTRNLENALKIPVLDRHTMILAIFKRNAKSGVAKLQVELAELQLLKSRLAGVWEGLSRQRGAAGGKSGRGLGETRLELDRRTLRGRIDIIRKRLLSAEKAFHTQSKSRSKFSRVALVGYTNAGKSSIMSLLTQSKVHVEDRLFATLDTTIRALEPQTDPKILISDTVGFVRDLPTELVASFKSTLLEATLSQLLLHVVDISDSRWREQVEVTQKTLEEIGAGEIPCIYVFNKVDLMESNQRIRAAEIRRYLGPVDFLLTSTLPSSDGKESIEALKEKIKAQLLEKDLKTLD
ncbi:MAG: GTPase HflX [Bdellovibrionota bacterium]